ncbi:MAG: amidohydrolase family protein [Clostridia bacterium]|nr:amidohydrolase family protein [Clostridia bacterium]
MSALKIVNARIPDYEQDCIKEADLLIRDGKIEKIASCGEIAEDAQATIDAKGQIVSAGFVDMHAHEDSPENAYFTSECCLKMGVTTKIAGNCGEIYDALPKFVERLKDGSPTNYMMFIGQNTLREMVGADDRYAPSTPEQIEKMKEIVKEWLAYSPVGLSCGFEYSPGVTLDETVELLKAFDGKDYIISVHFRSDGPLAPKSTEELVELSKRSGYKAQMSHIGSCSAVGYMRETLDVLEKARAEGVDIMADCYPYNAFCTGIGTAVFDEESFSKWDYSDLMLTAGPHKNERCTKELFEKIRKEDPDMYVVAFVMNEDEIEMAYKQPYVMVGSDCGFVDKAGHPRGAGTFPRILGRLVREKKAMSLLEALKKMTVIPAQRVNLRSKGEVKEGYDADLVIFDENTIIDRATFEEPTLPPEGISYVIMNGEIAVKDNEILNGRLGRYIPFE